MSKKLEDKDYRDHLREQIYFLQSSAKLYDLGTEIEAKRMATHMRVLLYDTQDSSSLLGQMRLKKKMRFISTAQKYDPTNLLSQQCLLSMTVGPDGGFYNPLFKNNNQYKLVSCREWGYEVENSTLFGTQLFPGRFPIKILYDLSSAYRQITVFCL